MVLFSPVQFVTGLFAILLVTTRYIHGYAIIVISPIILPVVFSGVILYFSYVDNCPLAWLLQQYRCTKSGTYENDYYRKLNADPAVLFFTHEHGSLKEYRTRNTEPMKVHKLHYSIFR